MYSITLFRIAFVLSLLGSALCGLPVSKRKKEDTTSSLHKHQGAGLNPDDFLSSFLSSYSKTDEPVLVSPFTTVSDPVPMPTEGVRDIQPRTDVITTFGTIASSVVLAVGNVITTLLYLIFKKKLLIAGIIIAILASFGFFGYGSEDMVNVVVEADRIQRAGGVGVGEQIRDLVGDQDEVSALMGDVDGLESYFTQGFKVLRSALGLVASTAETSIENESDGFSPTPTSEAFANEGKVHEDDLNVDVMKQVINEKGKHAEINLIKTIGRESKGTLKNSIVIETEPIVHDVDRYNPNEVVKDVVKGIVEADSDTDRITHTGVLDSGIISDVVVANIIKERTEVDDKSIKATPTDLDSTNHYQNLSDFDWLVDSTPNDRAVENENQVKNSDTESSGALGEGRGLVLGLLTPNVNSDIVNKDNSESEVNQDIEGVTIGYPEVLSTLSSVDEFTSTTAVMTNAAEMEQQLTEEQQSLEDNSDEQPIPF